MSEGLSDADLNGDGDQLDFVMTLEDRSTGVDTPLSAVIQMREPPFAFAAVATEGDTVAFFESEAAENETDASGDGDTADVALRIWQTGPGGISEIALSAPGQCPEVEPLVSGRPLALSDGLVFYRSHESACTSATNERISFTTAGAPLVGGASVGGDGFANREISGDESLALVSSSSTAMDPAKTASTRDLFLHDRVAGTTTWITQASGGGQADASIFNGLISKDGSTVLFSSRATNLVPGTPLDGSNRVYVHDVASGVTTQLGAPDPAGTGSMAPQDITPDGRFVLFESSATNGRPRPPRDPEPATPLLVRSNLGATELISIDYLGQPAERIPAPR